MHGAIIGDLAAWTWYHNKEAFYKKLIAEEAPLSEYGATMIAMAKPIFENQEIGFETLDQMLFGYLWYGTDISNDVKESILHHKSCMPFNTVRLIVNIMNALIGWSEETADNAKEKARKLVSAFKLDKEDYYAAWTLPKLIWGLRHGMSKNEALDTIMDFGGDIIKDKSFLHSDTPLGAISRAWDAFYRSFDFTSTIHSAVKSPINPRLTAALAGELAEAMYGCDQGMLKKKYNKDITFDIILPEHALKRYKDELNFIKEHREVTFFQKNNARTNVELHHWLVVNSEYEGKEIDKLFYVLLKKAFYTSWDYRYGFYLDDGWFYVYRSFRVICRFKVKCLENQKYIISDIQRSNEDMSYEIALDEAFYPIEKEYICLKANKKSDGERNVKL